MDRLSFSGPWLLDGSALVELDAVVESLWEELGPQNDAETASRAAKNVQIGRQGGRMVEASTLGEAARLHAQEDEVADTFCLEIRTEDEAVGLKLEGSKLLLQDLSPESRNAAQPMFGALRNWAENHRAPLWQRLWTTVAPLHWFLWLMGLFIVAEVASTQWSGKSVYRERAATIVEDGLSEDEIQEALEVLLRIEADVVQAEELPKGLVSLSKAYLVLGFAACVVLSFRPKAVLGIGRGVGVLRRWKLWIRIVGVSVPALLFGSFVLPQLEDIIRNLLS